MDKKFKRLSMGLTVATLAAGTYSQPVHLIQDGADMFHDRGRSLYAVPPTTVSDFEKQRLRERILKISQLEDDWDFNFAKAPLLETVNHTLFVLGQLDDVLELIDIEDIVPSSHGTINIYIEDSISNDVNFEIGKDMMSINGEISGEIFFNTLYFDNSSDEIGQNLSEIVKRLRS